jgi:dephospho-CoA kinase
MKTIAITGGIGSGKSTVTEYLTGRGYTVIDADRMSREMTSAGGKAMPYIMEHFGPDYVNEDGSLNRPAMRDLVFSQPRYKAVLEEGTTKVVLEDIEKIKAEKAAAGEKALFFDIPLLFEMHQEDSYDEVWVVTADTDVRRQRIKERDDMDASIIDLMIDSQEEDDVRLSRADRIIYNNGSMEELYSLIDEALKAI